MDDEKEQSRRVPPQAAGSPSVLPCPKCGSRDIHRQHAESGEDLDLSFSERSTRRENEYIYIDGWTDARVKKECIMHHCRCCQYDWETGVLVNSISPKDSR
jgi:hypothetical protein